MLNELALTRIAEMTHPGVVGKFREALKKAASQAATEAVTEYSSAAIRLMKAKLAQLELYRDKCHDDICYGQTDAIKKHAYAVACGRVDQIRMDIALIENKSYPDGDAS